MTAETVEAEAQDELDSWLKSRGGKGEGALFGKVTLVFCGNLNRKEKMRDESVVSYRDLTPKIEKVTMETFPFSETKNSLELARAGGKQDVVAIL